jgi:hypothetical protein
MKAGELITASWRAPKRIKYIAETLLLHAPNAILAEPNLSIREFQNYLQCLKNISRQSIFKEMMLTAMNI